MPPKRQSTPEERKIIISLHNKFKSLSQISEIVDRPRSTIQNIINRYGKSKSLKNEAKTGRPTKLNQRAQRTVVKKVRQNPKISSSTLAGDVAEECGITVTPRTIRNYLKKDGFNSRSPRRKFFVSKVNKQKRIEFATANVDKPLEYWNNWIFTDESKFNICGNDGKCRVWRKPNTELEPKNMIGTVKHGGGNVMVWGCMSANGVGNLHFVDGIMDQYQYIDILKANLRESAEKMGLGSDFIFQQDNDPKHNATNTKLWLLYNTPKYVKTPPQSPDLNPIEHLWEELERRIRKRPIRNAAQLKIALEEEWNCIQPTVTKNLVESMPRRLRAVIKSKGYPTKY